MGRAPYAVSAALLLAACAVATPTSAADPAQMDAVRGACSAIGLTAGEAPFADCVAVLRASLPAGKVPPAVSPRPGGPPPVGTRSQYACAAIGLDPASAQYSYCVTNLKQTLFNTENVMGR